MSYATGWYGIPGKHSGGQVHIAFDGRPVCGTYLSPVAEFQWCSHGVNRAMVECEKCKAWYRRLLCMECMGRGEFRQGRSMRWHNCDGCQGLGYKYPATPLEDEG